MKKMLISLFFLVIFFTIDNKMVYPQQILGKEKIDIKIGSMMALSGPGALWGLPISRSMEMYIEMINDAGGVQVGNTSYKFKFLCEDDKYKASVARSMAEKLIHVEKVDFFVGLWGSAPIMGIRDLAHEKKILSIVNGAAGLIGPKYPYLFQIAPIDVQRWASIIVLRKIHGNKIKKFALLAPNDESGKADVKVGRAMAQDSGLEMVMERLFERGSQDFTPFLTAILPREPDVIYGCAAPGDLALIIKQARELGYKGFITSNAAAPDIEKFIDIAGYDAVQGTTFVFETDNNPSYSEESRHKMKEIQARYLKKYGPLFRPVGWRLCNTIDLLVQAIKKAGSLDVDKIKLTLETSEFNVLFGKGKFEGAKTYGINRLFTFPISVGVVQGKEVKFLGDALVHRP
jgi:branched-chain amino acid transport system substrate-binding protein